MAAKSKSKSTSPAPKALDAVALLKADHKQVKTWFEEFEATNSSKKKAKLAADNYVPDESLTSLIYDTARLDSILSGGVPSVNRATAMHSSNCTNALASVNGWIVPARSRCTASHNHGRTAASTVSRYSLWTGDIGFAIYPWDCLPAGRVSDPR